MQILNRVSELYPLKSDNIYLVLQFKMTIPYISG